MNNTFAFKNAEEFKELYGMRTLDNGEIVRKNKLVLSFLKDWNCHKFLLNSRHSELLRTTNLNDLVNYIYVYGARYGSDFRFEIQGRTFHYFSSKYKMDNQGLCTDGDHKCVRYINKENGRVFKIKAGRLLKELLQETELGRNLPESTVLYMCEDFARQWESWAIDRVPNPRERFELIVDDDFEYIYNSENEVSAFHSCMRDDGYYPFYENAVKAHSARLLNEDGEMVARCVIFDEVHIASGEHKGGVIRVAERQYVPENNKKYPEDEMKQKLVNQLIEGGYIDAYKKVGASFDAPRSFVWNNRETLDADLWIECLLCDRDDTVSYQDTFKWFVTSRERAYNTDHYGYDAKLDTTNGKAEWGENAWDEYHECYCRETTTVHYRGRCIECDEDDLEDFVYVGSDYYHEDEVSSCPCCDDNFVTEDGYYSELTNESYCCYDCMSRAEAEYAEANAYVKDAWGEWIKEEQAIECWSDRNECYVFVSDEYYVIEVGGKKFFKDHFIPSKHTTPDPEQ